MSNETSDADAELSDSSVKPWTIRGIPPEERNAAIKAAKDTKTSLGEWLARAIRASIKQERQENRAPVPVVQPVADSQTALSDTLQIAASLREMAAAGMPVSKAYTNKVSRALVARLPRD